MAYDKDKAYDALSDAMMVIFDNECKDDGYKRLVAEYHLKKDGTIEVLEITKHK